MPGFSVPARPSKTQAPTVTCACADAMPANIVAATASDVSTPMRRSIDPSLCPRPHNGPLTGARTSARERFREFDCEFAPNEKRAAGCPAALPSSRARRGLRQLADCDERSLDLEVVGLAVGAEDAVVV